MTAVLAFILSPLGRYLAIGLAALVLVGGIYRAGHNSAMRKCDAAALRAEIAAMKQDLEATRRAEAEAKKAADELAESDKTNQERLRDLQIEIEKRPADRRCSLSPDDAKRLR